MSIDDDIDIDSIYEYMHSDEALMQQHSDYCERHGVNSASILTITDDEKAHLVAYHLADRIEGKTVIEIGAGIGILSFHLSLHAKRVIAIEADPLWTSTYVAFLHKNKPANVTFVFGAAQEVQDMIRGDVALFCTHSDHDGLRAIASRFAPVVIDVYREIIDQTPKLAKLERQLRRGEVTP